MQKDLYLETYVRLIGNDYQATLERFSRVLLHLGMPPDVIQRAADAFTWEVTDIFGQGCVNTWSTPSFKIPGSDITLYPDLIGYASVGDDPNTDSWICCGFTLDSIYLIPDYIWRGHVPWHFPEEAQQLIQKLAWAMHQEFAHLPIYFSDDTQDHIDAIMDNEVSKKWAFYYALFPLEPHEAYMPISPSHAGRFSRGCFEVWDRSVWPQFVL